MFTTNLRLMNVDKKVNSTKRPNVDQMQPISAEWVEDTDIVKPSFLVNSNPNALTRVNAVYEGLTNRYYWVNNVIWLGNNLYRIDCSCDVLATYRSEILNSSQFVARSASAFDGRITDGLYTMKAEKQHVFTPSSNSKNDWNTVEAIAGTFHYVLGIVSVPLTTEDWTWPNTNFNQGSIVYYVLNNAALEQFMEYLLVQVSDYSDITEYGEGIQKALINPMQYIVSCIAYPNMIFSPAPAPIPYIKFGPYTWAPEENSGAIIKVLYTQSTNTIGASAIGTTYEVYDLPKHPQAVRGVYMNSEPYTKYTIYDSTMGLIDIDTIASNEARKIITRTKIDYTAGISELIAIEVDEASTIINPENYFNLEEHKIVARQLGKFGKEIKLSQISSNMLNTITGLANSMITPALSGNIPGVVMGAASGLVNAYASSFPTVNSVGADGTLIPYFNGVNGLYAEFKIVVDDDNEDYGRPLMQNRKLNTLSGYVKCENAHMTLSAQMLKSEAEQIEAMLIEGVYIE